MAVMAAPLEQVVRLTSAPELCLKACLVQLRLKVERLSAAVVVKSRCSSVLGTLVAERMCRCRQVRRRPETVCAVVMLILPAATVTPVAVGTWCLRQLMVAKQEVAGPCSLGPALPLLDALVRLLFKVAKPQRAVVAMYM
jgi:hypothetical protein